MRTVGSIGLAVIALTASLLFADHAILGRVIAELDERPAASQSPGRVLSRIQADLERVAVGKARWPLPPGAMRDPLERLVDAEDAFLRGRMREFADHANAIRAEAGGRLAHQDELARAQRDRSDLDKVMLPSAYAEALADQAHAPPLRSLVQAMRLVDAVLVLEAAEAVLRPMRYDPRARRNIRRLTMGDTVLDDVWLRLPCPLVAGRKTAFELVAAALGDLAGPLLSCPVPEASERDFALMERLVKRPGDFAGAALTPVTSPPNWDHHPPSPPWDAAAAIRFMDVNPDGAEPPLRLAAMNGVAGKLDLALFLHAFRDPSAERNEDIRTLMASVDRASLAKASPAILRFSGTPTGYDGSDMSLVPSIRLAALARAADVSAGSHAYPYVIPCSVLARHPALLASRDVVVQPTEDDGKVDVTPPVSGCLVGRGRITGFPEADLAAFLDATSAADGGGNSPRYPVRYRDTGKMHDIVSQPGAVLSWPEPVLDQPYQTWSYGSLGAKAVADRLNGLYQRSRTGLAAYFQARGLSEAESADAARKALFSLAYGSQCGNGPPPKSLRRLIMDGSGVEAMAEAMAGVSADDLKPFAECAAFAPFDPLLHVAVAHPALPLLWEVAGGVTAETDPEGLRFMRDVNARNHFGKTALMVAAQLGRSDAAQFLLDKGARVNADTWQTGKVRTLAHDSRTALMYAASQGSAATIRLLVEAGADRYQSDTTGRRAIHYLLGQGPLPPNPSLTPTERAEMARLLF
ncbi:hypothetical protein CU669_10035 [Paramagnetospirillum kuznetsovii]|uniref:Uncharacterized protein n=1 Tax=Paramagnetospirillum kuznetsovii TaxID=2053833 RepID=A0A364NYN6_9PROT|nr:ankyrin repeat domain-containing protein [Paramagnetospirillum kuznetsovii]RAU22027.1 hypothetical protein CU669_10035 [Paramagnetospirillum kuznetsovii]